MIFDSKIIRSILVPAISAILLTGCNPTNKDMPDDLVNPPSTSITPKALLESGYNGVLVEGIDEEIIGFSTTFSEDGLSTIEDNCYYGTSRPMGQCNRSQYFYNYPDGNIDSGPVSINEKEFYVLSNDQISAITANSTHLTLRFINDDELQAEQKLYFNEVYLASIFQSWKASLETFDISNQLPSTAITGYGYLPIRIRDQINTTRLPSGSKTYTATFSSTATWLYNEPSSSSSLSDLIITGVFYDSVSYYDRKLTLSVDPDLLSGMVTLSDVDLTSGTEILVPIDTTGWKLTNDRYGKPAILFDKPIGTVVSIIQVDTDTVLFEHISYGGFEGSTPMLNDVAFDHLIAKIKNVVW